MTHGKDVHEALLPHARALRQMIPDVYRGFGELHRAAYADGALPTRTKELIAFAISVTEQCDGCMAAHARSAVRAGVSPEEAAEAIGVSIAMGGGPATVYGPRAFAAFMEYHDDAHPD
jgi:AhpD family alkylhydroperoxidase